MAKRKKAGKVSLVTRTVTKQGSRTPIEKVIAILVKLAEVVGSRGYTNTAKQQQRRIKLSPTSGFKLEGGMVGTLSAVLKAKGIPLDRGITGLVQAVQEGQLVMSNAKGSRTSASDVKELQAILTGVEGQRALWFSTPEVVQTKGSSAVPLSAEFLAEITG